MHITGKPIDITPVVYRLSWMRRHEPEVLEQTAKILDVHGLLSQRLTGRAVASWTSADPFGVLDIAEKAWSGPILDHLALSPDRFGALLPSGVKIGVVTEAAAASCGLKAGTPLIAAGGDGQCAGPLASNAAKPGTIYLNLGTALITGAWSASPAIGRYWRTMTSPTGEGYFLEGCQRAGAYFINWLIDSFAGGRDDPAVFDRLETAAAAIPIGSEGLAVCPYLTGCMDPHWDPAARATFDGLSAAHGIGHLYRAALEGPDFGIGPLRRRYGGERYRYGAPHGGRRRSQQQGLDQDVRRRHWPAAHQEQVPRGFGTGSRHVGCRRYRLVRQF